jgi:hypothetical protein
MGAAKTTFTALGKIIGTGYDYFDGTNGSESYSFAPTETYVGQRLEDVKYENDFYGLLNWKTGLKSAQVSGMEKIDGEDVYVVVLQPEKASEITYYISAKTFLPVRKKNLIVSSTSAQKLTSVSTMSDYRSIDGIMIPFKTVTISPTMGDVIMYVKEVKNNAVIDDKMFKPKK